MVLIDFPHKEMKSVGFVTRILQDERTGQELAAVYVPTTPNPTSGYLEIVPVDRLTPTDWTVDEAMTFIISGGAVSPDKIPFSAGPVGMMSATRSAQKLFVVLAAFFVVNAVLAEFIGVKIFALEDTLGLAPFEWNLFGQTGSLNFTAGTLLWPIVFIMTDIVNEYYGQRGVRFISWLGGGADPLRLRVRLPGHPPGPGQLVGRRGAGPGRARLPGGLRRGVRPGPVDDLAAR